MATRLLNGLDRLIEYTALAIFILAISALFLSLGTDVIVRYLTTESLGWPAEMPNLLFPWLVMGAIVAAAQRGRHIAVNAIIGFLRQGTTRGLMFLINLITTATFCYLAISGLDVVSIAGSQLFPISGISSSYAYMALVYGFAAIALTALSNLLWLFIDAERFGQRVLPAEVTE
ncbi:TRAP transporter small permease (plasmid) [Photobacterium sp. GJ3]|nr:TRAP transporter small permease [Photobacterium sp. GJ3]